MMNTKTCKNCQEEIIANEKLFRENPYLKSSYKRKIFCSAYCRNYFNNIIKSKNYVLSQTEHNEFVKEINEIIKGDIWYRKTNGEGYNPDITKGSDFYEIELFRKLNHFKLKASKWDRTKKHILILTLSDQSKKFFDETYVYVNKQLIKLS